MHARTIIPLVAVSALLLIAATIGISRISSTSTDLRAKIEIPVPSIGSIQVLNGCGTAGAADKVADFLRLKKFDVKFIGNAETWNYPFTMVISRTTNMTVARQVAASLKTDRCILLRTGDTTYNVTVIIGPDYGEKIR
jgi:hypothetical protein